MDKVFRCSCGFPPFAFGFDLRNITMSIPRSGIGLREESVWKTKTIDQVLVKSGSV